MTKMTNDECLRIFLVAANAGSLTVASQILNMSQPTVSKKIQVIEDELGTPVFRRHGRGVTLTSLGNALKRRIERHYLSIDDAYQSLFTADNGLSGYVRIAAVHTLNGYFIPNVISAFVHEYPKIQLQVMGRSSEDVIALVEKGEADIGFVYDVMVNTDQLEISHLHSETMVLIHHPDLMPTYDKHGHAIIDDKFPLAGFQRGYALQRILDGYFKKRARIIVRVETFDVLMETVRRRIAGAILPNEMPTFLVEDRGLVRVPLSDANISRQVVMISRPDDQIPFHIAKSKEIVRAVVA